MGRALPLVVVIALVAAPAIGARVPGLEPVPPIEPGPDRGARDPHEPIRVTSDAELMLPDEIAGNGVRSGNGTRDDPYIISRWTISGDDQDAVVLQDIESHVVLRDLELVQSEERAGSAAVVVDNSAHLRIEGVDVTGWQQYGVVARGSTVEIEGSGFALTESQAGSGDGPGGGVAVSCPGSEAIVRRSRFLGPSGAVHFADPGPASEPCRRIVFEGNALATRTGTPSGVFYASGGVRISNNSGWAQYSVGIGAAASEVVIRDNEILGLGISPVDPAASADRRRTAEIVDNRFDGSAGDRLRGLSVGSTPGWRVLVEGNRFEHYPQGAITLEGPGEVIENLFVDNRPGDALEPLIWVRADADGYREAKQTDRSYQVLRRNDILRAPADRTGFGVYYVVNGSAGGTGSIPLDVGGNYWGPEPPVVGSEAWPPPSPDHPKWGIAGAVLVDPVSPEPFILSKDEVRDQLPESSIPGWSVVGTSLGLGIAVLLRSWGAIRGKDRS